MAAHAAPGAPRDDGPVDPAGARRRVGGDPADRGRGDPPQWSERSRLCRRRRLVFTDPGTYNPADPDPSYIFALAPDGAASVVVAFPEPVFPNGLAVESDGSIVWDESYTGRVRRLRPDGTIQDLGRMPGDNPILDGMKIGADGRLYVTDLVARGTMCSRPRAIEGFHPVRRRADQLRVRWRNALGDRRRGPCRQRGAVLRRQAMAPARARRRRATHIGAISGRAKR